MVVYKNDSIVDYDIAEALEMTKPKNITLWVDKNRRSFADRFAVPCLLDNTGNFKDITQEIFQTYEDARDIFWKMCYNQSVIKLKG